MWARYDTFLDVEPITGTVYRAEKRLQINLHAKAHKGIDGFAKLQEFYLPMVWLQEGFVMPQEVTDQYKSSLGVVQEVKSVYFYAGQIGGALMLLAVGWAAVRRGGSKPAHLRPGAGHGDERAPLLTSIQG